MKIKKLKFKLKKKQKKQILSTGFYVLSGLVFVIAALMFASVVKLPGGARAFVVQTGSMEPNVKKGSVVIVAPSKTYSAGDVITFGQMTKSTMPITHRIKDVLNKNGQISFVTKGDANPVQDMLPVSQSDIIGKVRLNLPFVGYAVGFARNPAGFVLMVVVPGVAIAFDQSRKTWKEFTKAKRRKAKETAGGKPAARKRKVAISEKVENEIIGLAALLLIFGDISLRANAAGYTNSIFSSIQTVNGNLVSIGNWRTSIVAEGDDSEKHDEDKQNHDENKQDQDQYIDKQDKDRHSQDEQAKDINDQEKHDQEDIQEIQPDPEPQGKQEIKDNSDEQKGGGDMEEDDQDMQISSDGDAGAGEKTPPEADVPSDDQDELNQ